MVEQRWQADRRERNAQAPRGATFRCLGAHARRDAQYFGVQSGERLQDCLKAWYSGVQVGQHFGCLPALPGNAQGLGYREDGANVAPIWARTVVVGLGKGIQDVVRSKQVAHTHCLRMAQCFLRRTQHTVEPCLDNGERLIGNRLPGPDRRPPRYGGRNRKAVADRQMRTLGQTCRQQGCWRMVGDQHVRPRQGKNPLPGIEPSHISHIGKAADTQDIGAVHRWAAACPCLWGQGCGQHGNRCRALSGGQPKALERQRRHMPSSDESLLQPQAPGEVTEGLAQFPRDQNARHRQG